LQYTTFVLSGCSESDGPEPFGEFGPQMEGLYLGVAVDDHVIRVALEGRAGMLPVHPLVERIVHEEVGEQWRDRGPK
jgi:hypothetical protein